MNTPDILDGVCLLKDCDDNLRCVPAGQDYAKNKCMIPKIANIGDPCTDDYMCNSGNCVKCPNSDNYYCEKPLSKGITPSKTNNSLYIRGDCDNLIENDDCNYNQDSSVKGICIKNCNGNLYCHPIDNEKKLKNIQMGSTGEGCNYWGEASTCLSQNCAKCPNDESYNTGYCIEPNLCQYLNDNNSSVSLTSSTCKNKNDKCTDSGGTGVCLSGSNDLLSCIPTDKHNNWIPCSQYDDNCSIGQFGQPCKEDYQCNSGNCKEIFNNKDNSICFFPRVEPISPQADSLSAYQPNSCLNKKYNDSCLLDNVIEGTCSLTSCDGTLYCLANSNEIKNIPLGLEGEPCIVGNDNMCHSKNCIACPNNLSGEQKGMCVKPDISQFNISVCDPSSKTCKLPSGGDGNCMQTCSGKSLCIPSTDLDGNKIGIGNFLTPCNQPTDCQSGICSKCGDLNFCDFKLLPNQIIASTFNPCFLDPNDMKNKSCNATINNELLPNKGQCDLNSVSGQLYCRPYDQNGPMLGVGNTNDPCDSNELCISKFCVGLSDGSKVGYCAGPSITTQTPTPPPPLITDCDLSKGIDCSDGNIDKWCVSNTDKTQCIPYYPWAEDGKGYNYDSNVSFPNDACSNYSSQIAGQNLMSIEMRCIQGDCMLQPNCPPPDFTSKKTLTLCPGKCPPIKNKPTSIPYLTATPPVKKSLLEECSWINGTPTPEETRCKTKNDKDGLCLPNCQGKYYCVETSYPFVPDNENNANRPTNFNIFKDNQGSNGDPCGIDINGNLNHNVCIAINDSNQPSSSTGTCNLCPDYDLDPNNTTFSSIKTWCSHIAS